MRILITTEWYDPMINGVVVSVNNLRKGLEELGHDVRILTVSSNRQSIIKNGVTYISSVNVARLYPGARIAFADLRTNKHIQTLVQWKPDIIHSQSEFVTFYMARYIAAHLHIPIVHTYHTVYEDYTHYFIPNKRLGKSVVSRFSRQILSKTSCVIVPTEKVKMLLKNYGVTADIQVVPTGLDLASSSSFIDAAEKSRLRRSLMIPDENKILVAVGRLAKEKNLEEIMFFMSRLRQTDLTLLVVGGGPRLEMLREYAMELGISRQVVFAGMVQHNQISSYYQMGDVFVSASKSETQGLTTLEALSNGIPSLCRKDPSLHNVIQNGINGWQYESFDEFKEQLHGLLQKEGPYKITGDFAVGGTCHDNSHLTFAKKVEAVYFSILQESGNPVLAQRRDE